LAEISTDENQLLKEIYGIVSRIESRLQDMEARQVEFKTHIAEQPVVGSFASHYEQKPK
jgi:hypothetical protein